MKGSREKLGRSCDMCANYESQLQQVQNQHKTTITQLRSVERHLEAERQAAANHHTYTEELERKLEGVASEAAKEVCRDSLFKTSHNLNFALIGCDIMWRILKDRTCNIDGWHSIRCYVGQKIHLIPSICKILSHKWPAHQAPSYERMLKCSDFLFQSIDGY